MSLLIDDPTQARLRALVDEVLRVNKQFNLTAVRDPEEAWTKHVLDSLQGLECGLFEGRKTLIDVGTGAGFPGLPLAIARPHLKVTLLEATRKKCDFLTSALAQFSLRGAVINARAESAARDALHRDKFDLATARAVGSIGEVSELTLPFVKPGGHAVLWRGQHAPAEMQASKTALHALGGVCRKITPYQLPGHELVFHIVVIEKWGRTPPKYPRREGLPKHQPLVTVE